MRRFAIAGVTFALVALVAGNASASRIFGDIKLDGKPVAEGVKVFVTKPSATAIADSTTTDKFGSYKLMVKDEGKCVLTVVYEKQRLDLTVFSNKDATRYDLVLAKDNGKLTLRRK